MKTVEERGSRFRVSFHVCDLALLVYFCVMFAHQMATRLEMVLRYASLFGVVAAYLYAYPLAIGKKQGYIWRASSFELWMLAIMVYGGLSTLWSIDGSNAYNVLLNIFKVLVVCFVVIGTLNTREQVEHVLKLMLVSLVYMLIMLVIKTPGGSWGTERVGQVIGQHSNEIGRLCGLGSLLAFHFWKTSNRGRLTNLLLVGAFSVCAFMTGSKNAIFVIIFQFALYSFLVSGNWKRILVVLGSVAMLVFAFRLIMTNDMLYNLVGKRMEGLLGLFTGNSRVDGSTLERLYFMQTAWELFKGNPIAGVGMNNFSAYLGKIRYANAVYSHTGYLELLSTLGIIGLVIYYSQYVAVLKGLLKPAWKKSALTALLFTITLRVFVFDLVTISMYTYYSYILLMLSACLNRVLINANTEDADEYVE